MSETFSALSERARNQQQILRTNQMSRIPFVVRPKGAEPPRRERKSGRIIIV